MGSSTMERVPRKHFRGQRLKNICLHMFGSFMIDCFISLPSTACGPPFSSQILLLDMLIIDIYLKVISQMKTWEQKGLVGN